MNLDLIRSGTAHRQEVIRRLLLKLKEIYEQNCSFCAIRSHYIYSCGPSTRPRDNTSGHTWDVGNTQKVDSSAQFTTIYDNSPRKDEIGVLLGGKNLSQRFELMNYSKIGRVLPFNKKQADCILHSNLLHRRGGYPHRGSKKKNGRSVTNSLLPPNSSDVYTGRRHRDRLLRRNHVI